MTTARLSLTRPQILAFRQHVGALNERLPGGRTSLRRAAWAGLQDSMPRAALLSIHARVKGTEPSTWEDPSLAQLWGPRYSTYVVAKRDFALFSLGRHPEDSKGRLRAESTAERLHAHLNGAHMTDREAGRALGVGNSLRYAATTGTVAIPWDGARRCLLPARRSGAGAPRAGADRRPLLWTPRVWPGALLAEGEICGTWRRAHHTVRIDAWVRLSRETRDAIEAEASALPLPGVDRRIEVVWNA